VTRFGYGCFTVVTGQNLPFFLVVKVLSQGGFSIIIGKFPYKK
jgi:hypothetical protein